MFLNPLECIDFYKADHRRQYPAGTSEVYSNFTPRSAKHAPFYSDAGGVVFFGLQWFMAEFLRDGFNHNVFILPEKRVCPEYDRRMLAALGSNGIGSDHIKALLHLGYLPLSIKALPEGARVPVGVPAFTIRNTHPDFFWLTNYIETVMSAYLWRPSTAATIAAAYRKVCDDFADLTGVDRAFVDWQCHDFSYRGLDPYAAPVSGAAHLLSFTGTDTVPAIGFLEEFYGADANREMIGGSVPATEHSVMCAGGEDSETETISRLLDLYPGGIFSMVSDTWDFWRVLMEYLPAFKDRILARPGKMVIRPDSGDPVKILCGDPAAPAGSPEEKGAVRVLWDIFGGKVNGKGFKELDPHIGLIYGDSITLDRAKQILGNLAAAGFASSNVVFGVGSYTYQMITRDTLGWAVKATNVTINGESRPIFKSPRTDDGTKRSACGLLRVDETPDGYRLRDNCTPEEEAGGALVEVFRDGHLLVEHTLSEIRARVRG